MFSQEALAAKAREREISRRGVPKNRDDEGRRKTGAGKRKSTARPEEPGHRRHRSGRSHHKRARREEHGVTAVLGTSEAPLGGDEVIILDAVPLRSRPCPEEPSAPAPQVRSPPVFSPRTQGPSQREDESCHRSEGQIPSGGSPSEPAGADVGASGEPSGGPSDRAVPANKGNSAFRSAELCMDLVKNLRLSTDDQTMMGWSLGELVNRAYLGAVRVRKFHFFTLVCCKEVSFLQVGFFLWQQTLITDQLCQVLAVARDELEKEQEKGTLDAAVRTAEEKALAAEGRARAAEERAQEAGETALSSERRAVSAEEKAKAAELRATAASSEVDSLQSSLLDARMEMKTEVARSARVSAALDASRAEAIKLGEEVRRLEEKGSAAVESARLAKEKARLAEEKARLAEEKATLAEEKASAAEAVVAKVTADALESATDAYEKGFSTCLQRMRRVCPQFDFSSFTPGRAPEDSEYESSGDDASDPGRSSPSASPVEAPEAQLVVEQAPLVRTPSTSSHPRGSGPPQ